MKAKRKLRTRLSRLDRIHITSFLIWLKHRLQKCGEKK